MSDLLIPIFQHRKVRSWPKYEYEDAVDYAKLDEALDTPFETDAHFAGYSVPALPRRLHKTAPAKLDELGEQVRMVLAAFDCDGPNHTCPDNWWTVEKVKLAIMLGEQPNGFVYRTRGGYRVVYRLPTPVLILDNKNAAAWRRTYQAWLRHLERRYYIVGDKKCASWMWLFRLPHATRDKGGRADDLEVIGDTERIGTWDPVLDAHDLTVEKKLAPAIESERPLTRGASRLADPNHRAHAIEIIATYFPERRRHDFALALGSVLQRESKLDVDGARQFALEAFTKAGSQDPTARAQDVVDSYRTIESGGAATGIPTLRDIVGDDDVTELVEVLSDRRAADRVAVERLIEHVRSRATVQTAPSTPKMLAEEAVAAIRAAMRGACRR
jgi:hypothetical protein